MIVRIATSQVISEVVDDEAIIINSLTGAYYSLDPVGSTVWSRLLHGPCATEALERLVVEDFDVDEAVARTDAQALVQQLLDEGLVEKTDDPTVATVDVSAVAAKRPYATPRLAEYTDMEELLLLDPIHEVDAQGWPIARDDA
jgi:hypothetical protein